MNAPNVDCVAVVSWSAPKSKTVYCGSMRMTAAGDRRRGSAAGPGHHDEHHHQHGCHDHGNAADQADHLLAGFTRRCRRRVLRRIARWIPSWRILLLRVLRWRILLILRLRVRLWRRPLGLLRALRLLWIPPGIHQLEDPLVSVVRTVRSS